MTSKTRAQLTTEQDANFADNTTGAITPAILRSTVQDMIDSTGTLLDSNTWSGTAMSFTGSVAFSAPISLGGSTSGSTNIIASGAASGTLTLPATTDTIVTLAANQALTNKTINGITVSSGSGTLTLGTNTLTVNGGAAITPQTNGVAIWVGGTATGLGLGQIPATNTNDSASAGNIGEYVEGVLTSGSATAILTGSTKTITSITITQGDWDIDGSVYFVTGSTTNLTATFASISSTANSFDSTPGRFSFYTIGAGNVPTSGGALGTMCQNVPPCRFSFATSTNTINLIAEATFSVSTLSAYGIVRARRAR